MLVSTGCYEYIEENLTAPKSAFYNQSTITFRNLQTGASVSLNTGNIECYQEDTKSELHTSYHTYTWYYPEICAQRLDEASNSHGLSHWVRAEGTYGINNSSIRLIFENDRIKLPVISWNTDLGENVHLSTDSIDGVVFETVYVARPDFESHTHIDSVYYIPDTGVIRIFTTGGEIWQRVF